MPIPRTIPAGADLRAARRGKAPPRGRRTAARFRAGLSGRRRLGPLTTALALASLVVPVGVAAEGARRHGRVPTTDSTIQVDGRLDEELWSRALAVDLPWEIEPEENVPARVRTEVLLVAGPRDLYVGFRADDPEPDSIRSHLTDRDDPFRDDLVGIVVDPFNDERRGFVFIANPAGVQMDATSSEVDSGTGSGFSVSSFPGEDLTWDAIWSSAGAITEDGFRVEMAIPYTSLRFPRADGVQTWGFAAWRARPRSVRRRFLTARRERGANCFFCQVGKIEGFENADPGRNLEVVPTLTGRRSETLEDDRSGLGPSTEKGEAGVSVRWGITPNLNLNAAVNPDFSQVEADEAQLDVNTRFALFFAEKRPFFLEGADFFETPVRAVFSRTVIDPDWGAKFSGKERGNAFGVWAARDDRPRGAVRNLLVPGAESSNVAVLDDQLTTAVARYRRDLGRNSTVGVLYTGREGDEYHNRVAGVDGFLRFTSSDSLQLQLLRSDTLYPEDIARDLDQPVEAFDDEAIYARYAHDTRSWSVFGGWEELGAGFRADSGFVTRVDSVGPFGGGSYTWWGTDADWYTSLGLSLEASDRDDHAGDPLERRYQLQGRFNGALQSTLQLTARHTEERFSGRIFERDQQELFFNIRPTGDFTSDVRVTVGESIDVVNVRPADLLRLRPNITYDRAGWNLGLSHAFERLDVAGGELFTANLTELRAVYNLNVRTFVRGIFQRLDLARDPSLFDCASDPVDPCDLAPRVETFFAQLLFSYKVNPQTVVFAGYSENRRDDLTGDLDPVDRTVFVKLGYAWVL